MSNRLMVGLWKYIINVPPLLWEKQIAKAGKKFRNHRDFITPDHNRVHHFVVRELPFFGRPLPAEVIADELTLPRDSVVTILNDLERHMTFLFRNESGEVTWAYPVTVDHTPHRVTFDTGESIYAA